MNERNTKQVENTLALFEHYIDGVRLLMLTHRNKEGGANNRPDRFATKRISTNKKEFEENFTELMELKKLSPDPMRIYSSANPRNMEKGIRELKRRMLDADYYDEKSRYRFYLDIKNQWFSSLAKPNAKAGNNFLIDIDSDDEYSRLQTGIANVKEEIIVLDIFETKNGKHVITKPFNPSLLAPVFDIKKDGMLLLSF